MSGRVWTWAEAEFRATHRDPFTRDGPHEHLWRVRAGWDTTGQPRDVRCLKAALDTVVANSFDSADLDSFLTPATNETVAQSLLGILDVQRVEVWRPEGQCGEREGATVER